MSGVFANCALTSEAIVHCVLDYDTFVLNFLVGYCKAAATPG